VIHNEINYKRQRLIPYACQRNKKFFIDFAHHYQMWFYKNLGTDSIVKNGLGAWPALIGKNRKIRGVRGYGRKTSVYVYKKADEQKKSVTVIFINIGLRV